MKLRKVLSLALAAASLSAAVPAAALAAPACATPKEAAAAQVRQLQIDFMVAALKCRDIDPVMRTNYGTYVTKFGPALATNANLLKANFSKRYGKAQQREFDRYMTRLANEADIRSRVTDDYCGVQARRMAEVLAMPPADMEQFATRTMPPSADMTVCAAAAPAKTAPAAKDAKPGAELAKRESERKAPPVPTAKPGERG